MLLFAIGDGNHSLASAKATYEEEKKHTPQEQWAALPSRYALVELVNLHDESLEFEPIHRVCFGVDAPKLLKDLAAAYPGAHYGAGEGHTITYVWAEGEGQITVPTPTAQLEVGTLQEFLDQWLERNGRQRGLCPRRRRDPSAGGADRKHRVPAASYGQGSVI